jgi:hypothetical protein
MGSTTPGSSTDMSASTSTPSATTSTR